MEVSKLTVVGAGSVRCMPPIIGGLASFFGERPLEIRFFDADEERLDLFDRYARYLFGFNQTPHGLFSTTNPAEALNEAERVVLCIGRNCASRYFRSGKYLPSPSHQLISKLLEEILPTLGPSVDVLNLMASDVVVARPMMRTLQWPPEPDLKVRTSVPHQILRFLNGEDYPFDVLKSGDSSPFKAWLENVESAPVSF